MLQTKILVHQSDQIPSGYIPFNWDVTDHGK